MTCSCRPITIMIAYCDSERSVVSRRQPRKVCVHKVNVRRCVPNTGARRMQSVQRLGYELDGPGFESWQGQDIIIFSEKSSSALGCTKPPIQWVPVVFPLGREVSHPSPSSAEAKDDYMPSRRGQGKLCYLIFYKWRLNISFFPTGRRIFGIINEQKLPAFFDISGQPFAAFRLLRSYTVPSIAFTPSKAFLRSPVFLPGMQVWR